MPNDRRLSRGRDLNGREDRRQQHLTAVPTADTRATRRTPKPTYPSPPSRRLNGVDPHPHPHHPARRPSVYPNARCAATAAASARFQPLLSLHGHIHESRGVAKIGRTTAINPGSEYGEGVLRAALINLTPDGILSHQLIAG